MAIDTAEPAVRDLWVSATSSTGWAPVVTGSKTLLMEMPHRGSKTSTKAKGVCTHVEALSNDLGTGVPVRMMDGRDYV